MSYELQNALKPTAAFLQVLGNSYKWCTTPGADPPPNFSKTAVSGGQPASGSVFIPAGHWHTHVWLHSSPFWAGHAGVGA